jgi:hypothetical protein
MQVASSCIPLQRQNYRTVRQGTNEWLWQIDKKEQENLRCSCSYTSRETYHATLGQRSLKDMLYRSKTSRGLSCSAYHKENQDTLQGWQQLTPLSVCPDSASSGLFPHEKHKPASWHHAAPRVHKGQRNQVSPHVV